MNQRMITRSKSRSKESPYVIYKNAFQRNDDVLEACKKLAKHKNMGPIFQTKTYKDNDKKRRQMNVPRNKEPFASFLASLEETIMSKIPTLALQNPTPDNGFASVIRKNSPRLEIRDWVLLHSLPGCQRQVEHTDYDPEVIAEITDEADVPWLVLVALQDNTTLDVFDDQEQHKLLALDTGDILLFRSDLVHAGSAYTEDNLRLHAYLDSPFVKRIKNRTWYKKSLRN